MTFAQGHVSECCQNQNNLSNPTIPKSDKPELTVRVCCVCGRRHFRLKAEPGQIIGKVQPLGS